MPCIAEDTAGHANLIFDQNALAAANIYFTENNAANDDTVTVGVLAGTATGTTTSYLEDKGSLFDAVEITKKQAGNTISGSASTDGSATAEYTISTNANGGLTNSEIGEISNSEFTGTSITAGD